jgi:hypothetical protein
MKRPRRRMPKIEEIEELAAPNVSMADIRLADLAEHADRAPEDMRDDLIIAADMVEACSKILAGKTSWVQSMALAELLSIWVCSFYATGSDARAQQRFRARMLRNHIGLVRQLVQAEVEERARIIREQLREAGVDVGDDDGSAEA